MIKLQKQSLGSSGVAFNKMFLCFWLSIQTKVFQCDPLIKFDEAFKEYKND